MANTAAELLAARFARIAALLKGLEPRCSETEEQQTIFFKLKEEIDAVRRSLPPIK